MQKCCLRVIGSSPSTGRGALSWLDSAPGFRQVGSNTGGISLLMTLLLALGMPGQSYLHQRPTMKQRTLLP
jgi:hypothetical protein